MRMDTILKPRLSAHLKCDHRQCVLASLAALQEIKNCLSFLSFLSIRIQVLKKNAFS